MGGRSRVQMKKKEFREGYHERDMWITELSDLRLEAYGRMSRHKLDRDPSESGRGKGYVNYLAGAEWERRHGSKPDWAFDYPEKTNNPEFSGKDHMEGYRFLKTGEKIRSGDEYSSFGQNWEPVGQGSFALTPGEKFTKNMYPIRRKK